MKRTRFATPEADERDELDRIPRKQQVVTSFRRCKKIDAKYVLQSMGLSDYEYILPPDHKVHQAVVQQGV